MDPRQVEVGQHRLQDYAAGLNAGNPAAAWNTDPLNPFLNLPASLTYRAPSIEDGAKLYFDGSVTIRFISAPGIENSDLVLADPTLALDFLPFQEASLFEAESNDYVGPASGFEANPYALEYSPFSP